jgi:hypothetical protein
MIFEVTCRQCGAAYAPTRADLLLGPDWWQRCPPCRLRTDPNPQVRSKLPVA